MKRLNAIQYAILLLSALVAVVAYAAPGGNKPPREPTVSGMEVFSAGQSLGYLAYAGPESDAVAGIISSNGYLFEVALTDGRLGQGAIPNLYFTGTNCTGEAYTQPQWKTYQGFVFSARTSQVPDFAFYTLRGSQPADTLYASYVGNGVCQNVSGGRNLVRALPNDPSVTGVANSDYDQPIVFGIP